MGLFSTQLDNVVEWQEEREGVLLWKWQNREIKKGSKLIIRMGQDAIFMYNGKIEGIFEEEGRYDIESDIIPFLTTLKSFQFGFHTPLRAEVLFINTKEQLVKWGTKSAVNLPAPNLPGGMPIRAFGTFGCRVAEADTLIERVAGVKNSFTADDVKERIVANLDQLLMSWIGREGRDMFHLQADARNIAKGIASDLDMDMRRIGVAITDFNIESFSYPEEIKKMQEKAAAQSMIGDIGRYQQVAAADSLTRGESGHSAAADMVQLQAGIALGQHLLSGMQNAPGTPQGGAGMGAANGGSFVNDGRISNSRDAAGEAAKSAAPKFCPNCGTPTNGMKFCGSCGYQLF